MRETFAISDGYGIQSFSTWDAARKYLFVLRGRFAGDAEDCGYQGALCFDTQNGAYEHGTPATAHRVKQVLMAGFQCTLRDSNDPHPTYITITPTQMWTAKDMDAQWRRTQYNDDFMSTAFAGQRTTNRGGMKGTAGLSRPDCVD